MNRRNFLGNLGIGAAACVVAPMTVVEKPVIPLAKKAVWINTSTIPCSISTKEVLRIWRQTGNLLIDHNYQTMNTNTIIEVLRNK